MIRLCWKLRKALVFLPSVLGYLMENALEWTGMRENPLDWAGICCGIDACTVQSERFPQVLSLSPPALKTFIVFAFLVAYF